MENMHIRKHQQLYWLWLSLFVIFLDQFTKWLVVKHFTLYQPFELFSFFNLTLAHNTGAAFSFLGDAGGWQRWLFVIIGIAMSVAILRWLYRSPTHEKWQACGLALILGGAIGNIYDRIAYGYVIDFFDFHINTWHYATFNVADSAICIGVVIWLLRSLKNK